MGILDTVALTLDLIAEKRGYSKAVPSGGQLYPAGNNFGGIPIAGPLSFPGWPDRNGKRQLSDRERVHMSVQSSWVFSNIQAIAREFSAAELELRKPGAKGKTDTIDDHALAALWARPNPHMGQAFLMQYWTWQIELFGKAYLYMAPDRNDPTTIAEIWPVPGGTMRPVPHPEEFISGYEFKARHDAKPVFIPARYICYSNLPHPFDPRDGLSPLAAAGLAIETDQAQARWNRDFFGEDNAVPGNVISVSKDIQKADFERVKSDLMEQFGAGKRKTLVTRAGDIDVKLMGISQKDMEFITGRAFSRDEIDRVFGFPGGYWTASATEANARHAKAVMIENAVWPLLVMLAEDLNTQIMPHWFSDDDAVASFDDIRPRNIALEIQQTETHKSHWTIDELREAEGKEAIGDARGSLLVAEIGKGMTDGRTPQELQAEQAKQQAAQQAALDAQLDEATSQRPEEMTGDEGGNSSTSSSTDLSTEDAGIEVFAKSLDMQRWQRKAIKRLRDGKKAACEFSSEAISNEEAQAIRQALEAATTTEAIKAAFTLPASVTVVATQHIRDVTDERTTGSIAGSHLQKSASTISDAANSGLTAIKAAGDDLTDAEKALSEAVFKILAQQNGKVLTAIQAGEALDLAALDESLRKAIAPALVDALLQQAAKLAEQVGPVYGDDIVKPAASAWAETYSFQLVKGITETTQATLQKAVSSYQTTPGMKQADLAKLLEPAFGQVRAKTIAITEITRAAAEATNQHQQRLANAGIQMERVWRTNNDELTCDVCMPLNGKPESEWRDTFPNGPSAHPRCRCFITLRLKKAAS